MRGEPEILRRRRRPFELLHCPFLARPRVAVHGWRGEPVHLSVVGGVHCNQLPLHVR